MTVRAKPTTPRKKRRSSGNKLRLWMPLLDTVTVLAWGLLLLRFWITGRINVLLHPDYVWLAYSAGFFLVGVALLRIIQLPSRFRQFRTSSGDLVTPQHFSLFFPGWSSVLLLVVALFGLQFTPRPFASQVALDRGVTDSLTMTRSQPQSFRASTSPAQRSLVEWVRTLNVYPEPDAYTGQPANVEGFVIHSSELPENYIIISRFVITCCAADAYPVGIPVKLPEGDRSAYPADMWLRVEGEMITETLSDRRQLVIQAQTLEEIPEPDTPYDY